ncbi:MAG: 2-oxoglutarate oxidoreductase [Nitrospira bacterium HGW-Nitrospira-1]|nr:MAG: 2-oxoglutarate oxidoreductase [Nitrospira bacterium HGW-Nitrospira-1]
MKKVFSRPKSLKPTPFRYCPGCGHSLVHRIIAEAVDQLKIRTRVIGIAPVGCAVFAYDYFNFDMLEAAHGRPPAAATALKRVMPEKIIFSYQGDGDLAAIGTSEIIHAANRGENLSVFFINNANYGMTGGQMAPTTIHGQRTTTTPSGRDAKTSGYPLRVSELLATIEGVSFVERVSVDSYKNLMRAKRAVTTAFLNQIDCKGFSFVEILSPCPTNWGMTPQKALQWLREALIPVYPLGIIKGKKCN